MIIESIELTNFKKHTYLKVDFINASNLIIGDNYAGKTSIQEAILIGLFGNSAVAINNDYLITKGTGAKNFQIILRLSDGTKIVRTKNTSSMARGEDVEPFVNGHSGVNEAVVELLGVTKQDFLRVFTSEQGSPQQLLAMEGAELQKYIESCTGMGSLDATIKRARSAVSLNTELAKAKLANILSAEALKEATDSLTDVKRNLNVLNKNLAEKEAAVTSLRVILNTTYEEKISASTHNTRVTLYKELVRQANAITLDEFTITEGLTENINRLKTLMEDVTHNNNIQGKIEDMRKAIKEPPSISEDYGKYDKSRLLELSAEVAELSKVERQLKDVLANASCPTCKRPFKGGFTESEVRRELDEVIAKNKEVSQTYKEVSGALKRDEDYDNYLSALNRNNEKALSNIEIYKGMLREVPDVSGDVKAEYEALVNQYNRENARKTVAWNNNLEYHRLWGAVEARKNEDGEILNLEIFTMKINDLNDSIGIIGRDISQLQSVISNLKVKDSLLSQQIKSHERDHADFVSLSHRAELFKAVEDKLVSIRIELVQRYMNLIFRTTSQFISSCTDNDISEVSNSSGIITYTENGIIYPKQNASGAQKSLMGIGMKLGLSRIVPCKLGVILLDEVSADMSDVVSSRCMMALSAYRGQTITISHRQYDVAGNVISL